MNIRKVSSPRNQQGVFLIEAMVALVIFSIGILALIGLQGMSITAQSDAQYRLEAADAVNQLIGSIWSGVDRTNSTTFATTLTSFQHYPTNPGATCTFSGSASSNAIVTAWDTALRARIPNVLGERILVDTSSTSYNQVTVTICWQAPTDQAPRQHRVTAYITSYAP